MVLTGILVLALSVVAPSAWAQDVRLTGIIDGPLPGGLPKAIELYVVRDVSDLGAYAIGSANNGDGSDGPEFHLSGRASAGKFIYVASEVTRFAEFFEFEPDFVSSTAVINGDDAIELFLDGQVIDVFGHVHADPNEQSWDYLDGWAYRKNGTGPDAAHFSFKSWLWSGPNALDGTPNNNNASAPFPIGSYMPHPRADRCPKRPLTAIYDIQGPSDKSDLVGKRVTAKGIVTGDFQRHDAHFSDLGGFFIQERTGDHDPATSDGIFVFDGSGSVDVSVNDLVQVRGTVAEFGGETQLTALSVKRCARTPGVPATQISLPARALRLNSDGMHVADLEAFEGMLVQFSHPLTVTDLRHLGRFGEVRLSQGGRLFQFTNQNRPHVAGYRTHLKDIARRTITLDDGLRVQNPRPIRYPKPGFNTQNAIRIGDAVKRLTGNIRYSRASGAFGHEAYRLVPQADPVFVSKNPRKPPLRRENGQLRIASLNVLNFFNDLRDVGGQCFPSFTREHCRGADTQPEFDRQLQKLVTSLRSLDADIYGLQELENDYPDGRRSAIATLVRAFNASGGTPACGRNFTYVDPRQRVGDDAIAVGLMYCRRTVGLAPGTTIAVLDDGDLPTLGLTFTEPVFTGPATNRSPLAVSFAELESGEVLTVVVSHLKSKRAASLGDKNTICSHPRTARKEPNCDQDDGQAFWNARRVLAARALKAWTDSDPTQSGDPDILIMGDFNSYLEEEPLRTLESLGFENLMRKVRSPPYTLVFDAQSGALDHAMANRWLRSQVTATRIWHAQADEAPVLDYNLDFARNPDLFDGSMAARSSDHDALLVILTLEQ